MIKPTSPVQLRYWRRSPDLCLVITFFADVSVVDLDMDTEKQVYCIKANHEYQI